VRHQFGRPLASFQAVQHLVANIRMAVDGARLTANQAVWWLSRGQAAPRVVAYRELAVVPPLRQDIAVAAPEEVSAQQIMQAVRAGAGELLEDVEVFDVYAGEQVGEGRRSLALALSFRAPDRTLTDADVAPARERILAALAKLGGELRG